MKLYLRHKMLIALFALLPVFAFAQGGQDDLAEAPEAPVDTPLDGGLLLLLAAGAGYGARKYRMTVKSSDGGPENNRKDF